MEHATRRNFLAIAGAGTAAGLALGLPAVTGKTSTPVSLPADAVGAMAAYIHDLRAGEVTLMVEGRRIVITDHELVARLASAFSAAR